MTDRARIAARLAERPGDTPSSIARALALSPETVRRHLATLRPRPVCALASWLAEQWEPVTTADVAGHLGLCAETTVKRLRRVGAIRVSHRPPLWVGPDIHEAAKERKP